MATSTPTLQHTFECGYGAILAVVVRGDTVFAGCQDGYVKVLDLETKTVVRSLIIAEVSYFLELPPQSLSHSVDTLECRHPIVVHATLRPVCMLRERRNSGVLDVCPHDFSLNSATALVRLFRSHWIVARALRHRTVVGRDSPSSPTIRRACGGRDGRCVEGARQIRSCDGW